MVIRSLKTVSTSEGDHMRESILEEQRKTPANIVHLLEQLKGSFAGFAVDQYTHCLQLATRLKLANFSDEIVFIGLCHDIGKSISWFNHARIGAEILKPFVSPEGYWLAQVHQEFQARSFAQYFDSDPQAYLKHKDHSAFDLAIRFSDLDQISFDPDYATWPLEKFRPLIEKFVLAPVGRARETHRA